jgi:glycerol-3-phosphate dehydrogenase (NAD(P)+)
MIGAGSWGTALSIALGAAGWRVNLWARRAELAEAIAREGRNPDYLADFAFPEAVRATADAAEAMASARLVVLAVPSQGMRSVCEQVAPHVSAGQGVVSAAKGLEHGTGRRLWEVIAGCMGPGREGKIAVLSGPNLAPEVAAGEATVSVAACSDHGLAAEVQAALSTPRFRGFGDNTKAALITRGLAEMTRLGVALGARAETFRGLSGMGDVVATCASRKSRNHYVGYQLARGRGLEAVLGELGQVAEGVETTRAALGLAESAGVEMPITAAVNQVLFAGMPPLEAVRSLMTRAWRDELEG